MVSMTWSMNFPFLASTVMASLKIPITLNGVATMAAGLGDLSGSSISITINPSTFEISSFVPPVKKQGSPGIKFAPIGPTNMFNTGGTIQEELSFDFEEGETCVKMEGISYPPQIHVQSGCGNTNHLPSPDLSFPFYHAAKQLRQPFEDVLKEMCNSDSSTPICVPSDMFLPWTLDPSRMFNIPRIVCGGMGVLPVVIARSVSLHVPCLPSLSNSVPLNLASVPFPLHKNDSPASVRPGDDSNPMRAILAEPFQANYSSWPHNDQKQSSPHIKWLDHDMEEVGPGNVIYVAFGSQSYTTDVQKEEIALGLEKAGQPLIWVELKRKKARERAQQFGRKARQAAAKGGSSDEKLDQLIQRLVLRQENSRTL
ncbi:hypothetical protein D5086_021071 [Populus alba]|uniref:Uncharacterized protein n=1 Tax=Populus alba TaxID=43335 RepID=A0ACC4BLZ8_POPAL